MIIHNIKDWVCFILNDQAKACKCACIKLITSFNTIKEKCNCPVMDKKGE